MATQNSSNIPTTNNTLPYGNGTGFSTISAANNSVLITSGGGVPSMSATLPSAVQGNITSLGTNGTMGSGWATTAAVSGSNNTFTLRNTGTTTNSNARLLIQSGTNSNNAAVSYLFLEATLSTGSNLFSVAVDTADAKIKTYLGIPTTGTLIQSIDTAGNIFSPGTLSLGGTALLQNGSLSLSGGTSGTSTIQVPAVAGTSTLTLPTTNGTAGQALLGDGGAGTGYTWASTAIVVPPTSSTGSAVQWTNLTGNAYMLVITNCIAGTNGAQLFVQTSQTNGASYFSSGYEAGINYSTWNSTTLINSAPGSAFPITGPMQNNNGSTTFGVCGAEVFINNLNASTQFTCATGTSSWNDSTGGTIRFGTMGGQQSDGFANALQVLFSTGTIAGGQFTLYQIG